MKATIIKLPIKKLAIMKQTVKKQIVMKLSVIKQVVIKLALRKLTIMKLAIVKLASHNEISLYYTSIYNDNNFHIFLLNILCNFARNILGCYILENEPCSFRANQTVSNKRVD